MAAAPQPRLQFNGGDGIYLLRSDGKRYIDAASGTFNLPLGYNYPAVVDRIVEAVRRGAHLSSSFSTPQSEAVLEQLIDLAPGNIGRGWLRDITGSTANECAIKIAQKATGKTDVLSFFLSHHGQTQAMTAISGNAFRRAGFPSTSHHSVKVPAPYCYRCFYKARYPGCGFLCVERINDFIEYASSGSIACMIVEPVLGNGGNIVPPPGFFAALSQLCQERDIVLIADEVQTGIGRTGYFFASPTMGLVANIITLAKGLGGVGIPVAATLFETRLDVLKSYDHSFTSGANQVALAAAAATLEVLKTTPILEDVRRNGVVLGGLLDELAERHECIGDVRGIGYSWGIELDLPDGNPDTARANRIIDAALECGLVLRGSRYGFGNVVKVRPPLVTSAEEIEMIVALLDMAITKAN
jgi:4-aminobutyrate aminotransferase-like enzyme